MKREAEGVESESSSKTLTLTETRVAVKGEFVDEKPLMKIEETEIKRTSKRRKRS